MVNNFMKRCSGCKLDKPLTEFWKNKSKSDGLQACCKQCDSGTYGAEITCTKCGSVFKVNHRNIRKRKTKLCKPCLADFNIARIIKQNKDLARESIFTAKGYEYIRDLDEKNGYIFKHRKVMQDQLKRKLMKNEVVHHIDGDRLNNNLSNLYLTDSSGHRRAHRSLETVSFDAVKRGVIILNQKTGLYEIPS